MKRKLALCLVIFVNMTLSVHLQALDFMNTISVGEMGVTSNFQSTDWHIHLINFTMQFENGFGFHITPMRVMMNLLAENPPVITFVNAILYYDFFPKNDEIQLGPFVSVNTVNVVKIDSVECHAGIFFTFRTLAYDFGKHTVASSDWLTIRAGYEYLDGQSNFYAQIGIDLLTAFSVLAMFSGEKNQDLNKGY